MKSRPVDLLIILVWLVCAVAGSKTALATSSNNIDALHAKKQVTCSGCHGKGLPQKGDTVENERCIACHGAYEALANKTRPAQFPDRNPHQSHLGEIGCAVCHKVHKPSVVYCLNCHRKFNMKISGSAAQ